MVGEKVPETVSSGITVFTNSLLLPNPGVDYAIIYTDTRLFRFGEEGEIFYSNFNRRVDKCLSTLDINSSLFISMLNCN